VTDAVREALSALGIRRLLLAVHDASLPAGPDDCGHGAPLSDGGRAFLRFAARLGFHGIQFGPQGETTAYDPSPYDSTLFSRNPLSIGLLRMVEDGLLPAAAFADICSGAPGPERADHGFAEKAVARAMQAAFRELPELGEFVARNGDWIGRYRLSREQQFAQWVAHDQHRRFAELAHELGLVLAGDLQIGVSVRDAAAFSELLHPSLLLGAPPSRTNPEGQPWGYRILDPDSPLAGVAFQRARAEKLLSEFDLLRVDHPHGLIDPWVYTGDVREGSRLSSSPDVFPQWAIAREDQIDRTQPRHADGWVRALEPAQVDRYALTFDAVVAAAGSADRLIVEILSTQPYPVRRVLERHGLGQFRVTQKADPRNHGDVYRSATARPQDWIAVGTHDTEPIWRVTRRWVETGGGAAHAEYLGERLRIDPRPLAQDAYALARAQLADLFVGPAQQVLIFFPDLLGMADVYNRPGVVSPENWTLRVPARFESEYRQAVAEGRALHLPSALASAIRARGPSFAAAHTALLARLEAAALP
jgi:4-alpha-glucanotransferase